MKKIISLSFVFALVANSLFAQNADFKNNINVHYGVSFFNLVKGTLEAPTQSVTDSVRYSSAGLSNVPTIGFAWDYGVAKWFSIGIAGSYNQAKATVKDLQVRNNQGGFDKLGDFSLTVPRTTLATRLLFHYANKGRIDCYTGFRFGVGIWSLKASGNLDEETIRKALSELQGQITPDGQDSPIDFSGKLSGKATLPLLQAQFIAFGLRGYVTDNIGINGELAIGSPYFLSVGANYRF
jgi:hypothetical protein